VARPTPEAVLRLPAVTELSAGASHGCGLAAGQHGNGHLFPVRF